MKIQNRVASGGGKTTINFLLMLGFWLALITLYVIHGKRMMRIINDKIEMSGGKRHYMPHHYTSRRKEYDKSKNRKRVETALSWIALLLIILGLLSMLGLLGTQSE